MMSEQIATSIAAKERLAKLLASENIYVEHRADVSTAAFDIKNRVLILPVWKDVSKDVYDLLVLHEVGHALYTPLDGWHGAVTENRHPHFKGFLNVLEDARIEKRIKRKFPGGRKAFTAGYADLLAKDFFGLEGRDPNTLNLIDRINLHFKGGSLMNISFNSAEQVYVDRLAAAETWEEVQAIAEDLWDAMSQDAPQTDMNPGPSTDAGDDGEEGEDTAPGLPGEDDDSDSDDSEFGESPFGDDAPEGNADSDDNSPAGGSEDGESSDGESDEGDTETDGKGDSAGADDSDDTADSDSPDSAGGSSEDADAKRNEDRADDDDSDASESGDAAGKGSGEGSFGGTPFSETDKAFRDKEETLVDTEAPTVTYAGVAKDEAYNLDNIIIPNAKVLDRLKATVAEYGDRMDVTWALAMADAKGYRHANSKVVNYLAKEFEMRKAADASARASTSRTGVLDTNTLHSFKWNDDVFKKVTNIPDGKSHGLQMFVDWSGSMSSNMQGTIEQVLNLVLFCKKVNIPFDVYAFSDSADRGYWSDDDAGTTYDPRMDESKMDRGDLEFRRSSFKLIQLATSAAKGAAFNDMLAGLMVLRGHYSNYGSYGDPTNHLHYFPIPRALGLGGTPLNEAILSAIPVTNRFRAANGLQIVNVAFLTDGCGYSLSSFHGHDGYNHGHVIIRDRKSRREFASGGRWDDEQMRALLEILRIRTGANVVNFYVANPRPASFKNEWRTAAGICYSDESDSAAAETAMFKTARAEGGILIEGSQAGWDHHYLIMGGNALGGQDEGLHKDLVGAKKGTLKRAFAKAATGKLRNRVILRKFTELIAS